MDSKSCDFCKRDIGLKIFVNRYIFSSTGTNIPLDMAENQSELYEIEDIKSDIKEYLSGLEETKFDFINSYKPPSPQASTATSALEASSHDSENNLEAPVESLNTIRVTATKGSYSYPKHKTETSMKQYGFTGSTLRKGFLYVYLKHVNQWQEYKISEKGFLKRINESNYDQDYSSRPLVLMEQGDEPCMNIKHRANALTIVVPKPNEASFVYLKYSENAWSKATKLRNKSPEFYEKYMDKFDVKKFIAGQYEKGTFPMKAGIENFCADYITIWKSGEKGEGILENSLLKNNISKELFSYSEYFSYLSGKTPTDILEDTMSQNEDINQVKTNNLAYRIFSDSSLDDSFLKEHSKEELTEALSNDAKARILFGAVFAIDDPVGVVMDISAQVANQMMSDEDYTDDEKTVNTLEVLKNNFGINDYPYFTNEELKRKEEAKELNRMLNGPEGAYGELIYEIQNEKKSVEVLNAEERAQKAAEQIGKNKEWNTKYIQYIDSNRFSAGLATLKQKKQQQTTYADELDGIGQEFLKESIIADHFFFNQEKDNLVDGVSLGMCVNLVLESSKLCPKMNKYMGQYLYNTRDPNNYFLNFLALNSNGLRQKLNEQINKWSLTNLNGAFATQPFGDFINSFHGFLSTARMEELKFTLLTNISKAFLNITGITPPNALAAHPLQPLMISMFSLSEIKSERITFNSLSDFNSKMRNYYRSHQNIVGKDNGLGNAIKKSDWYYLYEKYKHLKYIDVPRLEVNPEFERNLPKNFREAVKKHAELLKKQSAMNVSIIAEDVIEPSPSSDYFKFFMIKVAIVGLQGWAICTVFSQSFDNKYEKIGRRSAAVVGLTMSTVEAVGALLNSSDKITSKSRLLKSMNSFILELTTSNKNSVKGLVWRGFGLFAGLIFGGFDVYNGYMAASNGEKSFGIVLGLSGVFVIGGSIAIFLLNPLGWIAIAVGIILSLIAYFVKENNIQIWIQRCLLSTNTEKKRFSDIFEQTDQLKTIVPPANK
ncbi:MULTISPECIES: T6SS effector BTH_I2691 family protein [Acinetobacter]|uniref:T6SS effector BTH_I2691 family protein n=1 Tax=Acinetobacter TaxID=469 RepID=UPI0004D7B695|nr:MULTISPECIES: T6SS effector BTH_I2691 family protein [unclassified Acinetobacter]KEC82352.1 hypothetical protein DT74_04080 [Acinetobacter sp. ETR1]WEE40058.1 MFS transporter [Acinetobacter sp. TAC-1]